MQVLDNKKNMNHEWGRSGMGKGYWWESQMETNHWEDQDAGEWKILKWRNRIEWYGLDRSGSG
jgi:hypothetical protein